MTFVSILAMFFYTLACVLIALYAQDRRMGPVVAAMLAVLLTPPIMLLVLWLTGPRGGRMQPPSEG
jgi:hypothetical protein